MNFNWLQSTKHGSFESGGSDNFLGCEPRLAKRQFESGFQPEESPQAELRRKIRINRAKWLANSKNLPISHLDHQVFRSDAISAYAVLTVLAIVFFLVSSPQTHRPSGVITKNQSKVVPILAGLAANDITSSRVASR